MNPNENKDPLNSKDSPGQIGSSAVMLAGPILTKMLQNAVKWSEFNSCL